jgi:hypothetical protein
MEGRVLAFLYRAITFFVSIGGREEVHDSTFTTEIIDQQLEETVDDESLC